MPSAADFLPSYMIEFMNFVTTMSPNFASGMISRLSALWRRDMPFLRPGLFVLRCDLRAGPEDRRFPVLLRTLRAVLRAALLAVLDALRVEHAAQDVVAHARQVLHAAAADHDDRVLLQVMALARDVADYFKPVGEPHLCNLAQSRVRLLRRRRVNARADTALLR